MKPISEQNLYEVLEVAQDATLQEIERAYRIARSTYQPDSIATYSVFSDNESGEIMRRVEEAYAVLADARMRREYDARLRREGAGERRRPQLDPPRREPPPSPKAPIPRHVPVDELDDEVEPADGVFDGPVLRRIRMSRGIELEEIAHITKINETYLQYIEANRFLDLPAPVYLRGFLREYAKSIRLDPKPVVESYMNRYREMAGEGR